MSRSGESSFSDFSGDSDDEIPLPSSPRPGSSSQSAPFRFPSPTARNIGTENASSVSNPRLLQFPPPPGTIVVEDNEEDNASEAEVEGTLAEWIKIRRQRNKLAYSLQQTEAELKKEKLEKKELQEKCRKMKESMIKMKALQIKKECVSTNNEEIPNVMKQCVMNKTIELAQEVGKLKQIVHASEEEKNELKHTIETLQSEVSRVLLELVNKDEELGANFAIHETLKNDRKKLEDLKNSAENKTRALQMELECTKMQVTQLEESLRSVKEQYSVPETANVEESVQEEYFQQQRIGLEEPIQDEMWAENIRLPPRNNENNRMRHGINPEFSSKNSYYCYCGFSRHLEKDIDLHIRTHTHYYSCPEEGCSEEFRSEEDAIAHCKRKHAYRMKDGEIESSRCNALFGSMEEFKTHFEMMHGASSKRKYRQSDRENQDGTGNKSATRKSQRLKAKRPNTSQKCDADKNEEEM